MLAVKHITECPKEEQAALPAHLRGPDAIIIRESRPGESSEPRNYLRRAIYALKGKAAGRKAAIACSKADALMFFGCAVAVSMGRWAQDGIYDPLPDLRELQRRATRLLARSGNDWREVGRFRDNLASYVRSLTCDPAAAGSVA